jgi:hypothetical protein
MWMLTRVTLFSVIVLWTVSLAGCFFSGGVSTFSNKQYNGGVGYLSSTERNGQWDFDGPPPTVGEVTDRPIYRRMQKEAAYSIVSSSKDYGLSEPYPERRRRITAIREMGAVKDNDRMRHYYEVEFEFADR